MLLGFQSGTKLKPRSFCSGMDFKPITDLFKRITSNPRSDQDDVEPKRNPILLILKMQGYF